MSTLADLTIELAHYMNVRKVAQFVENYIIDNGRQPTCRIVAEGLHISKTQANRYMRRLTVKVKQVKVCVKKGER